MYMYMKGSRTFTHLSGITISAHADCAYFRHDFTLALSADARPDFAVAHYNETVDIHKTITCTGYVLQFFL